jgi:glycosyltransferase involved in cell wall biosynthesis
MTKRLSICYAAPGQNLVPWAGPTRNVLNVAEALAEWADVTVAFRGTPCKPGGEKYPVIAIEPGAPRQAALTDDNAARGLHPVQHLAYCRRLHAFARQHAAAFDVVLEKGWRLSGLLSAAFRRAGVSAVLVENDVRFWTEPVDGLRQLGKYALHGLAHVVAGTCSRRAAAVIAETDELKAALVARRGIPPDRIEVVALGVDHTVFRPMDQASSRGALGIPSDVLVVLYVGAMDEYHDLEPVIAELAGSSRRIELHVVGDGEYRARYEAQAAAAGVVGRFHGRVAHDAVPHYIAAADLCIAPYRLEAFHGSRMTFSTLKIPEYMACGRPVASVPSAGANRLVAPGVSGFLFPNEAHAWRSFFSAVPGRDTLASMGAAAARAVESVTWSRTAARYLETCEHVLSARAEARVAPVADPSGFHTERELLRGRNARQ